MLCKMSSWLCEKAGRHQQMGLGVDEVIGSIEEAEWIWFESYRVVRGGRELWVFSEHRRDGALGYRTLDRRFAARV